MDFLLWIQSWRNPVLDGLFYALTQIGSEEVILALLAVVYWCVDRTLGLRLGLVLLGSQYLNEALKMLTDVARPFALPDSPITPVARPFALPGSPITPVHPETAQGTAWPSGHAQNTAAVWIVLAAALRRPFFTVLAVVVILGVGFSRLYLGVHWPLDVLGGWAIGALLAGLALALIARLARLTVAQVPAVALLALPVLTGLLLLLQPTETTAKVLGSALGLVGGWWLERHMVGFEATPATPLQQVIKIVIGLAVAFGIRYAMKPILGALPIPLLPDLLRYGLIGLWVAWLAPQLFVNMFQRAKAAPPASQAP